MNNLVHAHVRDLHNLVIIASYLDGIYRVEAKFKTLFNILDLALMQYYPGLSSYTIFVVQTISTSFLV